MNRPGFRYQPRPVRFFRRLAYAGGGSAVFRQRQMCEPGSHLWFAGSHPVQSGGKHANTDF
jgi:hypothetical protein